ncbi:PAS domain S-box protein [Paenibacillus sp. GCM10023248]|uniref:PAS domain S-box protein n=1 Tax=unclassified Paenibacillus TaxID=185978 RepID=UPI002379E4DA|nr:PAS domain S-box protein [Paenibacillus sp. MAHUQ-63]MDD9271091.1 PAS domain S-box protein [Paenibacillus sp. MAHUQ-63]
MSIDQRLVNESLFTQAFKYAPIGMVLVAPNGHILKANPAFCTFLGYSETELSELSIQQLTHPEDLTFDLQMMTDLLTHQRDSYQMEKKYFHKNGHIIWASLAVSLVRGEDNQTSFFISQVRDITERVHIEEKLRESQELYRIVSDNVLEIITVATPDGVTLHISPAVRTLLGYEMDEVIGHKMIDLWHPDDVALFNDSCLFQNALDHIFTCRVRHKQGHYVWFETTVKMIPEENGALAKVIAVGRDITKRKLAEDELYTTKERLESFVTNNGDAIWVIDREGTVLEVNPSFEKLFQWQAEEIIQRELPITPLHLTYQTRALHGQVLSGNSVTGYETVRQRKDGSLVDVSTTLSPIRDRTGEIIGIAGTCHDITEKKQAQRKLKASKEQLESFIVHHIDPVLIIDTDYRVVRINHAFEETFGWKSAEIVGTPVFELSLIPGSDKLSSITALEKMEPYSVEAIGMHKGGMEMPVILSLFTLRDEAGQRSGWALTMRDLTAYKQAEQLLINSEKLTVAGQLAAGIAHEIRNPITAIKGFTQLMRSGASEKKLYYDIMASEIERIEMILSELLILAKPQMVHTDRQDIRHLLAQVMPLLESQAILNNVEIVTEYEPDLSPIVCDENQLKQVCINFIKNAIEAMPQGGTLVIQAKCVNSQQLLLRFIDHGCGIPEHILSRLGQPFYTTKEKGTGLGFMVSKKIIENHNGAVSVFSKENEGTTIDVYLPTVG